MSDLEIVTVPKNLYYHEVAYVRRIEAENKRLRDALERADYYINRLEAAHRGHVVRDLDEACCAWESYKMRAPQSSAAAEH